MDVVVVHEIYIFLDFFSGYNKIWMHLDDQEKTSFVAKWGVFLVVVMMFGLKTTPTNYQRIIREIIGDYIRPSCRSETGKKIKSLRTYGGKEYWMSSPVMRCTTSWMASVDIIKSGCTRMARRKPLPSLNGAYSCQ